MLLPIALALSPFAPGPRVAGGGGSLAAGLIGYWKLEEATGASRLDASGNGHSLTDLSGATPRVGGIIGNGISANAGTNALSSSADLRLPAGDFTVSAWVNPTSLAGGADAETGRGFLAYHNNDQPGDWALGVQTTGGIVVNRWLTPGADPVGRLVAASSGVAESAWSHIVVRCAAGVYTIFKNGASVAFTTGALDTGWGNSLFSLGRAYTGGSWWWNGLVDEVGIWGVALSNAQVAQLYNGGAGLQPV